MYIIYDKNRKKNSRSRYKTETVTKKEKILSETPPIVSVKKPTTTNNISLGEYTSENLIDYPRCVICSKKDHLLKLNCDHFMCKECILVYDFNSKKMDETSSTKCPHNNQPITSVEFNQVIIPFHEYIETAYKDEHLKKYVELYEMEIESVVKRFFKDFEIDHHNNSDEIRDKLTKIIIKLCSRTSTTFGGRNYEDAVAHVAYKECCNDVYLLFQTTNIIPSSIISVVNISTQKKN